MYLFLSLVLSYAAWWIWRFTIQPALHPDRAKMFPYLIPCVYNPLVSLLSTF